MLLSRLKISTKRRRGHVKLDLFRGDDLSLLMILRKLFRDVELGSNRIIITKTRN